MAQRVQESCRLKLVPTSGGDFEALQLRTENCNGRAYFPLSDVEAPLKQSFTCRHTIFLPVLQNNLHQQSLRVRAVQAFTDLTDY